MKAKKLCIAIGVLMLVGVLIAPTYALPVPRYVIITTNEIVSNSQQLENFIAMKTHQGFRVTVVTEDDFDSLEGQPPNGRAEKIRQWLIKYYEELNIKYVLLIGDPHPEDPPADIVGGDVDYPGDIPMKRTWPSYFQAGTREGPTDFFYADLNSNWNYDGDDFFCEIWPFDGKQSPDPDKIGEDNFSVKWKGLLKVDVPSTQTEKYRISTWSDGGVAVLIDGEVVICDECINILGPPNEHPPSFKDAYLDLGVGFHSIEIWYRDYTGDAFIHLAWTPPGTSEPPLLPIIPKENLWHQVGPGWSDGGLKGWYFGDYSFTDYKFDRIDETIKFSWFRGDMEDPELGFHPNPEPEVYVGRIPVYLIDKYGNPNLNRYTELDSILQKIINYETDDSDISWRRSLLLPVKLTIAGDIDKRYEVGTINDIAYNIAEPLMLITHTRIYDYPMHSSDGSLLPSPDITPCTPTNVVNEWNNGYGMVEWATHGAPDFAEYILYLNNLPLLDDSKPSFTFQGSCNTGWPEVPYNLAYSLLKKYDGSCNCGGGVANVAGARMTSGSIQSLGYPYAENVLTHAMPAGMALDEAKSYSFAPEYPRNVDKNDILFNLYGDPNIHLLKTFPMQVVENPICGDFNGDGEVDWEDFWYSLPQASVPIPSKWAADVNCDGAVTRADTDAIYEHLLNEIPLQCCLDLRIPVKKKLFSVRDYITNLSDAKFSRNAEQMRKAISNKFYAVHELIDTGYYEGAYMKIENDIRSKMDGLQKDNWITDPDEQKEICSKLDGIKADLAVLMDQPK